MVATAASAYVSETIIHIRIVSACWWRMLVVTVHPFKAGDLGGSHLSDAPGNAMAT